MLESLDKIDWESLHHAYGKATDIPGYLIQLANETDLKIWLNIMGEFSNQIFHQATIYSATSYTIPFLNQILRETDVEKTHYLLCLIAYILQRSYIGGYLNSHPSPAVFFKSSVAVHETISNEIDLYLDLLKHPATSVRIIAIVICALLRDQGLRVADEFIARLNRENDGLVKSQLLIEIGRLSLINRSFEEYQNVREMVFNIAQEEKTAKVSSVGGKYGTCPNAYSKTTYSSSCS